MRILVTGATGTVGRHVVDQLLTAGVTVRALTRNPETAALPPTVEVVRGDLDSPTSEMFEGIDRMYLLSLGDPKAAIDRAKNAGVQRIVTLTSAVEDEAHQATEQAVEHSGLEWTHIRPGMFAANLLDWAEGIKTEGVVKEPYANARQTPVHEQDIAAVAATSLLFNGHNGQTYALTGPESLTKKEQAESIGHAVGLKVSFDELTPDEWRTTSGIPDFVADWLLDIWQQATVTPEPVLPTVEDVLGRPAKTVCQWAADHVGDFR
ncbi:NAD(P)H-binding protein [Kibdelosporangium philippinense]|uniref:NAD(P)H-binding protein n=1 Tax=Kibdelosporangium philippinense TaxID=211113 RepID=A0ABS8Z619_9PSEU|nr:NAD(P)H-binding protein [Kibdelosporangium philippinense]MCE7002942.1 NAD(P)H-binding protein [Kibdelosporangium philippinense]